MAGGFIPSTPEFYTTQNAKDETLAVKKLALIKSIQNGKDVRKPIVDMLEYIDEYGPDASTFSGLSSDAYVKEDGSERSLSKRIQAIKDAWAKDDKYDEKSERLIMTKGITNVVGILDGWPATSN